MRIPMAIIPTGGTNITDRIPLVRPARRGRRTQMRSRAKIPSSKTASSPTTSSRMASSRTTARRITAGRAATENRMIARWTFPNQPN